MGRSGGRGEAALSIGYTNAAPFNGDLAELLIYSRPLTSNQRAVIRAYLKEKWSACP